jgi:hypothetical protein
VFENDLVELDASVTLAAAEVHEHTLIIVETRRLQIAAEKATGDSERATEMGVDPSSVV